MLKKRLIPVLLIKDGFLVRSQNFSIHQYIGRPTPQIERYSHWELDELICLDISDRFNSHEHSAKNLNSILFEISKYCSAPLTIGGGIKSISHIARLLENGADKVVINTQAIIDPNFITIASKEFGTQAIVSSIDVKLTGEDVYTVWSHGGSVTTHKNPLEWALELQDRGAGEIFLNSIDRDGCANGFDLYLNRMLAEKLSIPLVCCGGAGSESDFVMVARESQIAGIAAGNYFHFRELSYPLVKRYLKQERENFR